MRLALSLLVLAVFCVSLMPAIYAQNFGYTSSKNPTMTYCVDISSQSNIEKKFGMIWGSIIKSSVSEWSLKLQEKSQNKNLWNLNLVFLDGSAVNSNSCDYTISFLKSHFLDKRFGNISHVNQTIEVYYGSIFDSFDGNVAYSHIMIRNVILHEIGHSLGLPHYEPNTGIENISSVMQFPLSALPIPLHVSDFDVKQAMKLYHNSNT